MERHRPEVLSTPDPSSFSVVVTGDERDCSRFCVTSVVLGVPLSP